VSAKDAPQSRAELLRWGATLATMQECDKAAGVSDKGTEAATSAFGRAIQARRGTS
jgi:hypothetical protein